MYRCLLLDCRPYVLGMTAHCMRAFRGVTAALGFRYHSLPSKCGFLITPSSTRCECFACFVLCQANLLTFQDGLASFGVYVWSDCCGQSTTSISSECQEALQCGLSTRRPGAANLGSAGRFVRSSCPPPPGHPFGELCIWQLPASRNMPAQPPR